MQTREIDVITVTLNPAIDRTLIIPGFAANKINRVEQTREMAGGKGVNVASALADFGLCVAVTGFLGSENAGSFEALFARKNIADHFLRINGSTRTGLKIVDPQQQQTTDINFPGLSPSASEFENLLARIPELTAGKPGWVVLSGSLPPGLPANAYATLATRVKERGWKVLVDTSGEPLREALTAKPTAVKPNLHELETLAGRPLPTSAATLEAVRSFAPGVALAVVSMDEKGALFTTATETLIARPPAVEVAGTVGAGDAMVAGIIAAHLRGQSLADSARLATAFALELLTRGQNDAVFTASSITPWLPQVTLQSSSQHPETNRSY